MATTPLRSGYESAPPPLANFTVSRRFLGYICDPLTGCFELRTWGARWDYQRSRIVQANMSGGGVFCGWFDDIDAAVADLARFYDVSVYITYNLQTKDLMARSSNRVKSSKSASKDENTVRFDWLYIDPDPRRLDDISSTDEELAASVAVRDRILADHPIIRASSIWGKSGNGTWISLRLPGYDPAEGGEGRSLAAHALGWLHAGYSTNAVAIDQKTKNPSRVGCVPGTIKCKGSNIPERPWRMATLDSPEGHQPVPFDLRGWLEDKPLPAAIAAVAIPVAIGTPAAIGTNIVADASVVADTSTNGFVDASIPPPSPPPGPGATQEGRDARIARARAYLATKDVSISGKGGHGNCYSAVRDMVWGFDLTIAEVRPLLGEWNARCQPPWSDAELEHKLSEADTRPDRLGNPRGYLYAQGLEDRANLPDPAQFIGGFEVEEDGKECIELKGEVNGEVGVPVFFQPPVVEVLHAHIKTNDKVCEYMYAVKDLYQKSNMLVEVFRDDSTRKIRWMNVPPGTPMVVPVTRARLSDLLSGLVVFKRKTAKHKRLEIVDIPDWCAPSILDRHNWDSVRPLVGITEFPVIRPDGSIVENPGYDMDTGMLWMGGDRCDVPEFPTRQDAREAADKILEVVGEFEFEDDVSKMAWLACLLTIIGRHLINGTVPLFFFEASTAGAGKSLLCDVIGCIASGREMTRTNYYHDPIEMDKRLLATVLSGIRISMLDNIEGDFGNSSIDSILTGRYISGRILGLSKMSPPLLVDTVFLATANNANLCGDIYRRIVKSRLVSSCERPDQERTDFKIKDLISYVILNRSNYIGYSLTILRAYIQAGSPCDLPVNVYGEWTRLIRGCVVWAKGIDPWENRGDIMQADARRSSNAMLVEGFFTVLRMLGLVDMTAGEILRELQSREASPPPNNYPVLREALGEIWGNRMPSSKKLGQRMHSIKDTIIDNLRLTVIGERNHSTCWSVKQLVDGYWRSPLYNLPPSPAQPSPDQSHLSSLPEESDHPDF
jgi:hypothetical protein